VNKDKIDFALEMLLISYHELKGKEFKIEPNLYEKVRSKLGLNFDKKKM
jgi:hypothetical protein